MFSFNDIEAWLTNSAEGSIPRMMFHNPFGTSILITAVVVVILILTVNSIETKAFAKTVFWLYLAILAIIFMQNKALLVAPTKQTFNFDVQPNMTTSPVAPAFSPPTIENMSEHNLPVEGL